MKKINDFDGIAAWTDAFIAYVQILLIKHETKAIELRSYMGTMRKAAKDASKDQWYTYGQRFRLHVSRNHTKKWSEIGIQLWLRFITTKQHDLQSNSPKICYDYNFKRICVRRNFLYMHICIKCKDSFCF